MSVLKGYCLGRTNFIATIAMLLLIAAVYAHVETDPNAYLFHWDHLSR